MMRTWLAAALLCAAFPALAQHAGRDLVNALDELSAPCEIAAYQLKLDAENARLAYQVSGEPHTSTGDAGAVGGCFADVRTKSADVYRARTAGIKDPQLRADARAVYAAWLAALWTDRDSPQAVALDAASATMDADSIK